MGQRTSTTLVAAALVLPLLAGCGAGGSSPAPAAAPSTSAAAPSSSAAAPAPSPSRAPSDETQDVKDALEKFVVTALSITYADGADAAYESRVRPLMTDRGYQELSGLVPSGKDLEGVRSQFGKDARSRPKVVGHAKVTNLGADRATTTLTFTPRVQRLEDGRWKTVKAASVDEDARLTLVRDQGTWLVDKLE